MQKHAQILWYEASIIHKLYIIKGMKEEIYECGRSKEVVPG